MEPHRDYQQNEKERPRQGDKEIGVSKRPRSVRSQGRRCFQKDGVVHRVKCSSKMQACKAWMLPIDCPLGVLVEGCVHPLTWVLLPLHMDFS